MMPEEWPIAAPAADGTVGACLAGRGRLSTVRRANRIVVIENGTIAETGAHEELIQHFGTYRRLYELQFAQTDVSPAVAEQ